MAVTDPKKKAARQAARKRRKIGPGGRKPAPTDPRLKKKKRPVKAVTAAQKLKAQGKKLKAEGVKLKKFSRTIKKAKGLKKVIKTAGKDLKKKGRKTVRAGRRAKSNAESIRTRKWL